MYTSCTSTQVAKLLWNSSLNASLPLQSLIQLGLPFAVYPPFVRTWTAALSFNFLKLQKKIIYSSVQNDNACPFSIFKLFPKYSLKFLMMMI